MNDQLITIVADFLAKGAPRPRAQLVERLMRECALPGEVAKDMVRGLLEARVIDPVTVCMYRASDGRVVQEAALQRGARFPALHPAV